MQNSNNKTTLRGRMKIIMLKILSFCSLYMPGKKVTSPKKVQFLQSLKINVFSNFIAAGIFSAGQLAIILMLSRYAGGDATVGKYALATSIVVPLANCFGFQLRGILVSDIHNKHPFASYFWLRIYFVPAIILGSLIWAYALGCKIDILLMLMLVVGFRITEYFLEILFGLFQKNKRSDFITRSRLIFFFGLILVIATVLSNHYFSFMNISGEIIVAAIVAIELFALTIFAIPSANSFQKVIDKRDKPDIAVLLKTAFPMGVTVLLLTVSAYMPRYIIKILNDEKTGYALVGQLSVALQLIVLQTMFLSAFGSSFAPIIAETFFKKIENFKRVFLKGLFTFLAISLSASLVIIFVGPLILQFSKIKLENISTMMLLIAAYAILVGIGSYLGTVVTSIRIFKIQIFVQIINIISFLLFGLLLIPKYSLVGCMISLIIPIVIVNIFLSYIIIKKHHIQKNITWDK